MARKDTCCITGISNTALFEACHISGWADDVNNRTNPKNGLCMNVFFHRAYDKHLMAVTPDYTIIVSEQMLSSAKDEAFLSYLLSIQNRSIIMPWDILYRAKLYDKGYKNWCKYVK